MIQLVMCRFMKVTRYIKGGHDCKRARVFPLHADEIYEARALNDEGM